MNKSRHYVLDILLGLLRDHIWITHIQEVTLVGYHKHFKKIYRLSQLTRLLMGLFQIVDQFIWTSVISQFLHFVEEKKVYGYQTILMLKV